jgi:hypothetical protein
MQVVSQLLVTTPSQQSFWSKPRCLRMTGSMAPWWSSFAADADISGCSNWWLLAHSDSSNGSRGHLGHSRIPIQKYFLCVLHYFDFIGSLIYYRQYHHYFFTMQALLSVWSRWICMWSEVMMHMKNLAWFAGLQYLEASNEFAISYLVIDTSAQLRSRFDVWLDLKASLQTVQHALCMQLLRVTASSDLYATAIHSLPSLTPSNKALCLVLFVTSAT